MAEVESVDFDRGQVITSEGKIDFDYLVLAAGSGTAYFGLEGVKKHSFGLKDLADATSMRNQFLLGFERAVLAKATGTRFAGQLKAYRAAPEIFLRQHRLAMLEETLPGVRKYVVLGEDEDTEVYIIDLQKSDEGSLYDLNLEAIEAVRNK